MGDSGGEPPEGSGPDCEGKVGGWESGGAEQTLEYWQVDTRERKKERAGHGER